MARTVTPSARRARTAYAVTVYALLTLGALSFLFPLFWMISTSVKTDPQIFAYPPKWIPEPVRLLNYLDALAYFPFWLYLRNSAFVTVLVVIGQVLSAAFVAYGFSRLRWPGRDALFLVVLATMMIPGQITMIPQFILFTRLGWVDTFLPLIVPSFFGGGAFNIFLFRQFYRTIPRDYNDAARIDGCSELRIFWQIVLPQAKPAVATASIFAFLWTWNDFMGPVIYLHSPDKFTLPIGLRAFQQQTGTEWGMLMAASLVVMLPVIAIFFAAQRYFIQGMSMSGLKG
ncbi:MAG TPA: carbohydrate ABC transporter permease [Deinococcales bacterium]|nr:carbohydrate ABC transporter permease [Deinococcales bacterium]